jgi:predicted AlkP superfamily pyrophosphatase or phosphodiesterase
VFVVVDGLGANLVNKMDTESFLPRHLAMELQTVFPSTTSAVFTSLATAKWPSQHGIVGWDMYLQEIHAVATIIRFARRSDEKSLGALGVDEWQAYPVPSLFSKIAGDLVSVVPEDIAGTPYSNYWAGHNTTYVPYSGLTDGVDKVVSRARTAGDRSVTHFYTPYVDNVAHEYGAESRQTFDAMRSVDRAIERMAKSLPSGTRVILTADHGQLSGPVHEIWPTDPLVSYLEQEPWGDSREMHFAVRPSSIEQFEADFRERFGDLAFLLTTGEVETLELLGPGPIDDVTMKRLGTHLAISRGPDSFKYRAPTLRPHNKKFIGHHSGLTPDEMLIPLIVV